MHPHYHARVPSLGSTARVHVNPIDGYQCSNELRAQLNLTNDHKRKKHHTCKDVLLPRMSCKWLRSGCLLRKGRLLSWLPAMWISGKEKAMPGTAARCSTQRHRPVRPEKRLAVHLDELLIQKCKFRHRVTVNC